MAERTTGNAALPDPRQRASPDVKTEDDGSVSIVVSADDQLRQLFGVRTDAAARGILKGAINALGIAGGDYRDLVASMAVEMEPQDAVEAMLVSQITATHVAMTTASQKSMDATSWQIRESFERSMTRLSRTFVAQMEALKKYRATAQQIVRVERVTVHEGGQAIVGSVRHGGRADGET